MASLLIRNPELKSIDISRNGQITNKSISILIDIIKKTKIEEIELTQTSMSVDDHQIKISLEENKIKNGTLKKFSLISL